MSNINSQLKPKKTVYAPPPTDSSLFTSIYSIEINEDEEVKWQWLELPDGNRVVVVIFEAETNSQYSNQSDP